MNKSVHSAALTLPLLLAGTSMAAQEKPVNVVYILADDMGYGDLGCFGQQIIKTPNIDRMAREGMLFRQHYAGCTVSAPSRCSLMTGLHTGHSQIRGNQEVKPEGQYPMAEGTFTLGRLMQRAGYATGIFGKWGLGYPGSKSTPNDMGFDEFYGYNCQRKSHTYYPEYLWHNDRKVPFALNANGERNTYSADSIHTYALRFIKENAQRPFFAMLTYTLPHAEVNVPHDDLYQELSAQFQETPWNQAGSSYHASEKPKASFAAMIERFDRYVGDVLRLLQTLGLDKNTLVIVTSDNGPHREGGADPDFFKSYGPFRGVKRDMYEGGIRVPMVAWMPGTVPTGAVSDHVSAFWDMMPTLAELTRQRLPVYTDGISFLPVLIGKGRQKEHSYLYWEFHEEGGKVAVRMGDWKGIKLNYGANPTAPMLLYNLQSDLAETTDVALQHPDIVEKMEFLISHCRTDNEKFNFKREINK